MKAELVLSNPQAREAYAKAQLKTGSEESQHPLHIGTNLGISRDMITQMMMYDEYGEVHPLYRTQLEVFVPSLDTIAEAYKTNSAFAKLLCELDMKAKKHGLYANMRDIHGNVWEEKFLVLGGTMEFAQFEIDDEYREMQANNGSLYSIKNKSDLERTLNRKERAFCEKLSTGDFFYSPPGYAHGIIEAHDAHYIVDIFGRSNWKKLAKKIYGGRSPKLKELKGMCKGWSFNAKAVHTIR